MLKTNRIFITLTSILFLIYSCKNEPFALSKITAKTIAVDSTISSVNEITRTIAPYKEKMIQEINTVISFTPNDLVRTDGNLESSLGNLLADLSFELSNPIFNKTTGKNIDFALFNYGGIRASINKGNVTNKHAFELMPFENMFVVVELTGEKMKELLQYLIKNETAHPISKHVRLTISKSKVDFKINQKPFNKNTTYHVLTSDYLQSGGDQMVFFKNPVKRFSLEYKIRDGIINYFKSVDTLKSKLDGRFKRN